VKVRVDKEALRNWRFQLANKLRGAYKFPLSVSTSLSPTKALGVHEMSDRSNVSLGSFSSLVNSADVDNNDSTDGAKYMRRSAFSHALYSAILIEEPRPSPSF